jgi:hypothetical protein
LRAIPVGIRQRMTVLYQRHPQQAVATALRALHFGEVVELHPGRWHRLGPGVEAACWPSRRIDSALAVRAAGVTVLNLNDCKIGDHYLRQIGRAVGPVDLLLGQFSIAGWVANADEAPDERRFKVIRRTAHYGELLQPRALGLFASHAWFCHADNRYLNAWSLSPREALAFLQRGNAMARPVQALMPGDEWRSAQGFAPAGARLAAYDAAVARHCAEGPVVSATQARQDLLQAGARFLAALPVDAPAPPQAVWRVHVDDLGIAMDLAPAARTLRIVDAPRGACHIALGSQALLYCLQQRWGFDTLDTSARYTLLGACKEHPVLAYCYAVGAAQDGPAFGWRERCMHRFARRGELADRWLPSHSIKPADCGAPAMPAIR